MLTHSSKYPITMVSGLIIYLFSLNAFTPIERCAIIFVIAQVGKLLIGQKNYRTMQGVIAHS